VVRSRFAFSMIELIFAIVIIAISVMSLPMMTQATAKGIDQNLVQEAIFAAATELNQAVTFHWDANSYNNANPNSLSRVINISADCNAATKLRPGHINQPLHRRCLDDTTIAVSADTNDTTLTNLNNAAHASQNIFTDTTLNAAGYKKAYNSTVTVVSNADFNGANPNIKKITISVNDASGNLVTSLYTYSANIGEVDYYKRSY